VTVYANVNRKIVETIADISLWIIIAAIVSAVVALLALITILKKVSAEFGDKSYF
jgi:uncharacterized protein HemY